MPTAASPRRRLVLHPARRLTIEATPEASKVLRGARRCEKGACRPGRAGDHKFTVASMVSRRSGSTSAESVRSLLVGNGGNTTVLPRPEIGSLPPVRWRHCGTRIACL